MFLPLELMRNPKKARAGFLRSEDATPSVAPNNSLALPKDNPGKVVLRVHCMYVQV